MEMEVIGRGVAVVAGLVLLVWVFALILGQNSSPDEVVCFGSKCFIVDIADSPGTRARGLMFVEEIPANVGMLFIFDEEAVQRIWMRNMKIPLDIVWLDDYRSVVWIERDVQPCGVVCQGIAPPVDARYVLEINSGALDRSGINLGAKAVFGGIN